MTAERELPLVSVCIGSYNREKYIRETLDSVCGQTYPNIEIIVVDDASTDRTVEIVESYGRRVRLVRAKRNSGLPSVPRNMALAEATGEFIAFLDSDDSWQPEKIEKQVRFLNQNSECGLVHCYACLMDGESRRDGIRHDGNMPQTGMCFSALLRHCFITMSTVMVRRDVLTKVGAFNPDPRYRAREDLEWLLRVARQWPVGLISEPLANYRRAATGISQQLGAWRSLPEDTVAHRLIVDRPDIWQGVVPRSEVVAAYVNAALENCQYWRDRGFPDRALWFAWNALKASPGRGEIWAGLLKSLGRKFVPATRTCPA